MSHPLALRISLSFAEVWAVIEVEGLSGYAPDAIADAVNQATHAFTSTISELRGHGIMRTFADEDEDEDSDGDSDEDDD